MANSKSNQFSTGSKEFGTGKMGTSDFVSSDTSKTKGLDSKANAIREMRVPVRGV